MRTHSQSLALIVALYAGSATADTTKSNGDSAIIGKDSTNIDFSAANIDGKMQAPSGFFLQGREAQAMTQMVKLRAKFRGELRNSKSAVKDLAR
ncbi:MAG: hypothetical protein FJ146_01475 [Deltaproteobacteria bacterium]|nr:hypothetical protein [Deltaproteobacteria bacterium]